MRVTLLTHEMKPQYKELYDAHLDEMGGRPCRPNYNNTLVLLDGSGNLVSSVCFSYSTKRKQFTEMHALTQPDHRRMGYAKLLLNAFARIVRAIPDFDDAKTCVLHCETDNEEALKYHHKTAKYIGTTRGDYGSGNKDYATFIQDVDTWLGYTPKEEYDIDEDAVYSRFLTRVLQFKIREPMERQTRRND